MVLLGFTVWMIILHKTFDYDDEKEAGWLGLSRSALLLGRK